MKKENILIILLIVLAVGGLVVRNFPFNQGNLDKNMPPIITSFDLFAGTSYAKYIYDSEDARYNPPYRIMGVEKSLTIQPVFYFLFIASFTKLTSLSPYQTTTIITHLVSVLVILSVFLLTRKIFNTKVALICAALASFPEAKWLFQLFIGFQYDQYSFLFVPAALFFLLMWFNKELSKKQIYLSAAIIGIFAVSQWLSHFVEFFLYLPFFFCVWFYFAWKNKFSKEYIIFALIASLIFIPFFTYFYPITKEGHLSLGFSENLKVLVKFGNPSQYPSYWPEPRFGMTLNLLGFIGLFYLLIKTIKKEWSVQQKIFLMFSIYLIAIGFSNYIGIDANRVSRQLFNGLSILSLFPAFGIYLLYCLLFKNQKTKKFSEGVFMLLILGIIYFSAPLTYASLSSIDSNTFVNDAKWQSIEWIRDNTPQNSKVFYLNGFFHEFSMFGERPFMEGIVLPNPEAMQYNFQNLCSGKFPDKFAGHWGNGEFAGSGRYLKERTGISNFTYIKPFDYEEAKKAFNYNQSISYVPLNFFDYVVVQYKGTNYDPCVAFFLNQSLSKDHKVAWNNDEMAILKIERGAKTK